MTLFYEASQVSVNNNCVSEDLTVQQTQNNIHHHHSVTLQTSYVLFEVWLWLSLVYYWLHQTKTEKVSDFGSGFTIFSVLLSSEDTSIIKIYKDQWLKLYAGKSELSDGL